MYFVHGRLYDVHEWACTKCMMGRMCFVHGGIDDVHEGRHVARKC